MSSSRNGQLSKEKLAEYQKMEEEETMREVVSSIKLSFKTLSFDSMETSYRIAPL